MITKLFERLSAWRSRRRFRRPHTQRIALGSVVAFPLQQDEPTIPQFDREAAAWMAVRAAMAEREAKAK